MNIAISTNSTWNFIKFREGLAKSLLKKKHNVFVLSKNDKYKKYIPKNIKFIKICINRSPISLINDLLLIFFFLKILKKYKIDLVLGFSHKINNRLLKSKTASPLEVSYYSLIGCFGILVICPKFDLIAEIF